MGISMSREDSSCTIKDRNVHKQRPDNVVVFHQRSDNSADVILIATRLTSKSRRAKWSKSGQGESNIT